MADALVRVLFLDTGAEAGADRIGRAFERMERSAPTRALRQLRFGLDELVASAAGLHPALGRVASALGSLSGLGVPVVGALALIGLEMKSLIGQAGALEQKLVKLDLAAAAGTRAEHFVKAGALRAQALALAPTTGGGDLFTNQALM